MTEPATTTETATERFPDDGFSGLVTLGATPAIVLVGCHCSIGCTARRWTTETEATELGLAQ